MACIDACLQLHVHLRVGTLAPLVIWDSKEESCIVVRRTELGVAFGRRRAHVALGGDIWCVTSP